MSSEGAEAGVENALCHLGGAHVSKLQVTCYESYWLVLSVFLGPFQKFHLSTPSTAQLFCGPPIKAPPSAWKGRPVWGEEEGVRARSEGESVSLGLSPLTVRGKGVPSKSWPGTMPHSPWLDLSLHFHGNRQTHEVWLTPESGASGHHGV